MENITLVEPQDEGRPIDRKSEFLSEGHFLFKVTYDVDETIHHDGSCVVYRFHPEARILTFVSLINIASIADSISGTSAAVTGVTSAIWSAEEPTRKSLDIGILRYPDSDNSVFKLYRMKLDVWASRYNVVLTRNYNNGITAELTTRCYKPRESNINEHSSDAKKVEIKAIEALFS
ncbi:hypothetical protein NLI96_g11877 [Meripilus lineatus]|uniref:Uncharacterized protein n=1 Tax=Meripilus lineatus TaxID=2056292 RepID=A0AAD5UQY1_9APHY|nr:hypothetical protein NLI96_g11877 [Physisporinus lineatus]